MAITVSFTTEQTIGEPQNITINDTSTGTDGTAVSRRIYLVDNLGNYITENGSSTSVAYTTWPLAQGSSITLDVLEQDMALNITLCYVTSGGAVANGATDTELCGFTLYNETFYYSLTQAQASQNSPPPTILQDSNYYMNKTILRTNIDAGNQAISLGDDITSAQSCYDLATYMTNNQADFFNGIKCRKYNTNC